MPTVPTVLIVDDSRLSRLMIRTFISQAHPCWEIIEASNGQEALEKTACLDIDAMTIDLNMPGMDGLTLATTLKARHPQARITLLTANIQDSVRQRATAMGVGFLAKPITEQTILAFLAEMEHHSAEFN
ncbi:MAG: response regulator transcription factor [Candidatus Tectimicrobiota bacterium]